MRFEIETRIAAPPSVVFACHECPGVFQRLVPPWERVELISGGESIREGTEVVFKHWFGPVPFLWVLKNTEHIVGSRFEQKLVRGPFKAWYHSHVFYDDYHGGTIVRDELDYELPLGSIGSALLRERVRRRLGPLFAYRHDQLRRIVESGEFSAATTPRGGRVGSPPEAARDRRIEPFANRQPGAAPAGRGERVRET
jgi:ligand-binding SRPBCC domain-containing protein